MIAQAPILEYQFYEKPTITKYVILECSAMDYSQKLSILSNDLVRRLLNTKESLPQEVKDKIVNDYSLTLLRSGYNISSVRQIIVSGLRDFKNKVQRAVEAGRKLHKSLDVRMKNKIYAKTSWFKHKKRLPRKKYTKKLQRIK